jgi:hypothetical protein
VDTTRGAKLKINVDIVFPKIGCDFLSLDAQDVSGEQHIAIGELRIFLYLGNQQTSVEKSDLVFFAHSFLGSEFATIYSSKKV